MSNLEKSPGDFKVAEGRVESARDHTLRTRHATTESIGQPWECQDCPARSAAYEAVESGRVSSPDEALEAIFRHGNRFHFIPDRPYRREANWFRTGDGSRISVIAGWGTYCAPRPGWPTEWGGVADEYEGPFDEVEAWLPGDDDPGQISVDELREWIATHGGLVAGPTETEEALQ